MTSQENFVSDQGSKITAAEDKEVFTLSRFSDAAASAKLFTATGSRAKQYLMELKMAMMVKAW